MISRGERPLWFQRFPFYPYTSLSFRKEFQCRMQATGHAKTKNKNKAISTSEMAHQMFEYFVFRDN